jgi:hypothetical protein
MSWKLELNPNAKEYASNEIVVRDENGGWVADVGRREDDDAMKRAQLIAAAPDMLEALKLLLDHRGMMGSPSWAQAAKVLAKAEGKS